MVVDAEPRKAGIDPFNKLIDRNPENNIVAVSAGGGPGDPAAGEAGGLGLR